MKENCMNWDTGYPDRLQPWLQQNAGFQEDERK